MKIRTKLTLRYALITAATVFALVLVIVIFADKTREKEFFLALKSEAVTKANLFLSGLVDPGIMHDIYLNNREFINEVEVAVYDSAYNLVYHDATEIDLIKETPEMFSRIIENNSIEFYENEHQAVGFVYDFNGLKYIITAAAYDGYGYAKQSTLVSVVIAILAVGLVILIIVGYLLAKSALSPVAKIVDEVESVTGKNLDKRLSVENPQDELGELAHTFNLMLDRLETSFNNQKMFVSNISHELRTPLSALIAEFELVLFRERTVEEYHSAIEKGLADARKIERLSSGMLDLARADYDSGRISLRDIRLDELLLDARDMVLKANKDFHVDLIFNENMEDEKVITVRGNEYLLKTAFVNLIENNCKFSDNHTSMVYISFFGKDAILSFSDNGIGLPKEEADKIFTPFYRGANSGETFGHGIGMALVKKIIQLHDGVIEVHSDEGEGTVFICQLPHI